MPRRPETVVFNERATWLWLIQWGSAVWLAWLLGWSSVRPAAAPLILVGAAGLLLSTRFVWRVEVDEVGLTEYRLWHRPRRWLWRQFDQLEVGFDGDRLSGPDSVLTVRLSPRHRDRFAQYARRRVDQPGRTDIGVDSIRRVLELAPDEVLETTHRVPCLAPLERHGVGMLLRLALLVAGVALLCALSWLGLGLMVAAAVWHTRRAEWVRLSRLSARAVELQTTRRRLRLAWADMLSIDRPLRRPPRLELRTTAGDLAFGQRTEAEAAFQRAIAKVLASRGSAALPRLADTPETALSRVEPTLEVDLGLTRVQE